MIVTIDIATVTAQTLVSNIMKKTTLLAVALETIFRMSLQGCDL